jgi:high-affinity iron transporter
LEKGVKEVFASFLITLREGIEAALIVGIILGYLKKVGAKSLERPFYLGIGLGILASVGVAVLFAILAVEFEGKLETVFEGTTMFVSMAILTTVILWMNQNSKAYSEGLKQKVEQALTKARTFGMIALAFISIFREGVETVLFLGSTSFTTTGAQVILGGVVGLLVAFVLAIAIIKYSARLDMRTFFKVTGILLIMFAAGLVSRGIFEFQEAGYIAPLVDHVWNSNWIVNDQGSLGMVLTSLFGYDGSPSLSEIAGYVLYWLVVTILIYRDRIAALLKRIPRAVHRA